MNRPYFPHALALLLFGSNGIVASLIALSSYEIVFWRTLIGGILLTAVFFLTKGRFTAHKNPRHLSFLALSGASMGASWMLLYEAYTQIGVGVATLAYYTGPVIVMVLSPLVFGERLSSAKALGFMAVLIGMALVNGQDAMRGGVSQGLLCAVASAVMYALMVILNKKASSITGLENALIQLTVSFLTVAVFVLIKQGFAASVPEGSILPLLLLGIVNTGIGCYLYFSSIARLSAQSVAILGYLEPLSALVFSALFLKEYLSGAQLIGAALILGGAAFGEFFKRRKT